MNETATPATRRRTWWWLAPVATAVLLVVAAWFGVRRPGGFVVLAWLSRPFLFGTAALGLLAPAAWLAVRHRVWRPVPVAGLVLLAVGWAGLGVLAKALRDDLSELSRHPSPDGDKELVLYRGANLIDPTWELRLRSGAGLTTREWDLGCVNSDQETLTDVTWTGPTVLRLHLTRRGRVDIAVDAATGRPDSHVSVGC